MEEWRRRQRSTAGLFVVVLMIFIQQTASAVESTASLVLEEVLEHGPLFDELEDEAWWSGVDVVDTALRSWPEATGSADPAVMSTSNPWMDEEDFCRLWKSVDSNPSETCLIFNRALTVDLSSAGSSQMMLLPRLPPPPPVPPTLTELVQQLNQLSQLQQELQVGNNDNSQCLLCQWATLNGTIDLLPNSELSSENTWVPMLVVVALVSAMLGAVLMITALKCRRFKVLPRGGSCPTLPVGYMVGEGKEGVVQTTTELSGMETLPKNYSIRPTSNDSNGTSTLGRPRLETPTVMNGMSDAGVQSHQLEQMTKVKSNGAETGWRMKLWRKMTGSSQEEEEQHGDYCQNPYLSGVDQSDDMSAVYAELNSVAGSTVHRPSPIYHLNTYSEIREPHHILPPPPTQATHHSAAATLHLRRLLSDGTYENAGYALERGVILMEHDAISSNCSASTPSSAYYSDLSNSDRSGSLHHQQQLHWPNNNGQPAGRPRPRVGSESHGSSHSLPPHQHCCHHHHLHHLHHQHSRSLQEQQMIRARDLMPVALQVIPDNQQVPVHYLPAEAAHHLLTFSRGGVSASMRDESGTCKRPLPPLPSRQQQRPQRRYAYAVDHQIAGSESPHPVVGGGESPALSCVPSEYV